VAEGAAQLRRVQQELAHVPLRAVACSGGIDSLLLATLAHRADPRSTVVVHSVTPAVPAAATARVFEAAAAEGWSLRTVRSREFEDPRYLSNPIDRCYVCKSHLYDAMADLVAAARGTHVLLSGANTDDLGEYRPGLVAAAEHGVRHPYVAAGIGKADIRAIARDLDLDCADLPASPCLASRLYTGTEVTPARLRAVEVGEELVTRLTGIRVVRCRVREDEVRIEIQDRDRPLVDGVIVRAVLTAMRTVDPSVRSAALDDESYRPGRAFELTPVSR
jgi:pyridinium-3,5-biscarboxylic acid mononucleotide sulfurtransferase